MRLAFALMGAVCLAGSSVSAAGPSWVLAPSEISPSPRFDHAMTYDSTRGRVVLFGGYDGSTRNDTWEWDGNAWVKATPAAAPSSRSRHAMTYDSVRGRTLLADRSNVLWEW